MTRTNGHYIRPVAFQLWFVFSQGVLIQTSKNSSLVSCGISPLARYVINICSLSHFWKCDWLNDPFGILGAEADNFGRSVGCAGCSGYYSSFWLGPQKTRPYTLDSSIAECFRHFAVCWISPFNFKHIIWLPIFSDPFIYLFIYLCVHRNVSSAGIEARQALRLKEGLVEALLYLVRGAIDQNHMDNKSVENVICVLRNLSYRCEEVVNPNYDKQQPPGTASVGAAGGSGQSRATAQHSGQLLFSNFDLLFF